MTLRCVCGAKLGQKAKVIAAELGGCVDFGAEAVDVCAYPLQRRWDRRPGGVADLPIAKADGSNTDRADRGVEFAADSPFDEEVVAGAKIDPLLRLMGEVTPFERERPCPRRVGIAGPAQREHLGPAAEPGVDHPVRVVGAGRRKEPKGGDGVEGWCMPAEID